MKYFIFALVLLVLPLQAETVRSAAEVRLFHRITPCPLNNKIQRTCKGYVVDHIIPLACGGPDKVTNMQFQTVAEGKAKDKWERKGCQK